MSCPQIQTKGFCTNPSCALAHPAVCLVCHKVPFLSSPQHDLSPYHLQNVFEKGPLVADQCYTCSTNFQGSVQNYIGHYTSSQHAEKCISAGVNPSPKLSGAALLYCRPCGSLIRNYIWEFHLSGRQHRDRLQALRVVRDSNTETQERLKSAVEVTPAALSFGTLSPGVKTKPISHFTIAVNVEGLVAQISKLELASETNGLLSPSVTRSQTLPC